MTLNGRKRPDSSLDTIADGRVETAMEKKAKKKKRITIRALTIPLRHFQHSITLNLAVK